MNRKIINLLKKPVPLLIWSLICGGAYLSVIGKFIKKFTNTSAGGNVIIWVFFPAIVCGAALIIIKLIKQAFENENDKSVLLIFYFHFIIIIAGIMFFLEALTA